MLLAGAALLAVFFVIETKVEAPLLPLPAEQRGRIERCRLPAGSEFSHRDMGSGRA
jgi:hypothetical protein